MNAGTRQILRVAEQAPRKSNSNDNRRTNIAAEESAARVNDSTAAGAKPRVFVAAENRLLREALSRMLVKSGEIDVVGMEMKEPFRAEDLLEEETDVLLMSSRGIRNEDLTAVRKVRTTAPKVRILLIGVTGEQTEFLQCVRAGVRGYLPRDASAEGLTNKEIANRFCLSEQTVKNHLYRMKQKIGAEDRLGIVQVCRTAGFMP